ncbi:transaldolase family protein [Streptomyces sp. URMC 123]|uniref:transaldolase family protein n=1 Tax=Streptomyces sp. URMC 123 TaxID=3423403 RepID=UPI003F1DC3DC
MTERTAVPSGAALRPLVCEGVSPWLDGSCRSLLASGATTRLVRDTGMRGALADPAILATALTEEPSYRDQLGHLAAREVDPAAALRAITAYDARWSCDELLPVYEATEGRDGYVSMDLDPRPGRDPAAIVAAALSLTRAVNRPNVLVKIPATAAGLAAVRDCLALRLGVHVTEVFSTARYQQVVDAYFDGLERARGDGLPLSAVASVVSVPVARLDQAVDSRLRALGGGAARRLSGAAGTALARLLYRVYEERLGGTRWRALTSAEARPQRLVWLTAPPAPAVAEPEGLVPGALRYAERLVAWGTVSALPPAALRAGVAAERLTGDTLTDEHEAGEEVWRGLEGLGIGRNATAAALEAEGERRGREIWRRVRAGVREGLRAAALPRTAHA